MNDQTSIFYLIGCFFLLITNTTKAQHIQTAEDSLIFKECAKMPMAASEYNFSYSEQMLNLEYQLKQEEEKPLSVLLEELDQTPDNVLLAKRIAFNYKKNNDLTNYTTYIEYAYKQCLKQYEQYPDSFEIVLELSRILLLEAQYTHLVFDLLNKYTIAKPKDVRGLTQFALLLSTRGNIKKARHLTEKAYSIDSSYAGVYLSAMICEFTNIILQMNSSMASYPEDKNKVIQNICVDDRFLKKAITNNNSVAAQMSLDAVNIFAIFYKTVLKTLDKEISKEVIRISPNSKDKKVLRAIEKRAKKQLKSKVKNKLFAYQTLCIIETLRGNRKKAVDIFEKSGPVLQKNTDVLRFLSLGYFLVLDYNNAILYLEKVLAIQTGLEDLYTLGRFYSKKNDLEKAYQIFDQTEKRYPSDRKATCAKAAIHIQEGNFEKAFELIDAYPDHLKDDINAFHVNYFTALTTLIKGNKNDAFKRLKAIHAQSEYKENAAALLAHFFKAVEEEENN